MRVVKAVDGIEMHHTFQLSRLVLINVRIYFRELNPLTQANRLSNVDFFETSLLINHSHFGIKCLWGCQLTEWWNLEWQVSLIKYWHMNAKFVHIFEWAQTHFNNLHKLTFNHKCNLLKKFMTKLNLLVNNKP